MYVANEYPMWLVREDACNNHGGTRNTLVIPSPSALSTVANRCGDFV